VMYVGASRFRRLVPRNKEKSPSSTLVERIERPADTELFLSTCRYARRAGLPTPWEIDMRRRPAKLLTAGVMIGAILTGARASADSFAEKTVTVVVGYSAGGGYDQYARTLARYLGSHIPGNPSVVVQNVPGASTLLAVRHLDDGAPTDGTVITMFDPGLITSSLATPETIKINLSDYRWIGTLARDQRVCYSSAASGVKTWQDLMSQSKFMMGATSKGADAYVNGAILRKIFHAPVIQVAGYPGSAEQRVAVENGELEGLCASWASLPPEWISDNKINVLVRFSAKLPDRMSPKVPYVLDLAKSSDDKSLIKILSAPGELARPFIVSQKTPPATLAILRRAMSETIQDAAFGADLKRQSLPLDPISGADAEKMIGDIYGHATPTIVAQIKNVLG
jgi:tripartite-type tricarboxylate transporter receptor subunit TctC